MVSLTPISVQQNQPNHSEITNDSCILRVALGEAHSLFLDHTGAIFGCGWSEYGQTPASKGEALKFRIKRITGIPKSKAITAGSLFSGAITCDGQVYMWGNGEEGQLGLGVGKKFAFKPAPLESLRRKEVAVEIVGGENYAAVLCESGRIYGWGHIQNTSNKAIYLPQLLKSAEIVDFHIYKDSNELSAIVFINYHYLGRS